MPTNHLASKINFEVQMGVQKYGKVTKGLLFQKLGMQKL